MIYSLHISSILAPIQEESKQMSNITFRGLEGPSVKNHGGQHPSSECINTTNQIHVNFPETRALEFLTKSPDHQHLLKHPVFMSFLSLKWERIHRMYNQNLRMYMLFVYILTWYIFKNFGGTFTENQNNSPYALLFSIGTGLYITSSILFIVKDFCTTIHDCDGFGILYRFIEFFVMICLTIYIIFVEVNEWWHGTDLHINGYTDHILLSLTIIMTIREVFQMMVSLMKYFCGIENWIELFTIGIIYFIILNKKDETGELNRILGSFLIVLTWSECIVMVSKHPYLAK